MPSKILEKVGFLFKSILFNYIDLTLCYCYECTRINVINNRANVFTYLKCFQTIKMSRTFGNSAFGVFRVAPIVYIPAAYCLRILSQDVCCQITHALSIRTVWSLTDTVSKREGLIRTPPVTHCCTTTCILSYTCDISFNVNIKRFSFN